jgi:glycylpeptide N-tetradecanoyltransferase
MPPEESKVVSEEGGTGKENVKPDEPSETAKGKQPAIESEDEDAAGDDQSAEPSGTTPATGGKKKRSKRKKIKDAISGKPADPTESIKNAIGGLSHQQMTELLALNPALAEELGANTEGTSTKDLAEAMKKLNLQDIMTGLAASGKNAKDMGAYKFWQTQPVPKFGDSEIAEEGPLKTQKLEDVPKEPPPMVDGFEWVTMDLTNEDEMKDVWELLNGHYVEDDESMFRFNYSRSILQW